MCSMLVLRGDDSAWTVLDVMGRSAFATRVFALRMVEGGSFAAVAAASVQCFLSLLLLLLCGRALRCCELIVHLVP